MTSFFVPLIILGLALPKGVSDVPTLSEASGPYLVNACRFEGPDAESLARVAAKELRDVHGLPSYLLGDKSPGRKRFVVLVGDAKTWTDAQALLARVRKIKPGSLRRFPSWVDGKPTVTVNPLLNYADYTCTFGSKNLPPRPPASLARPPLK